MFDFFSEVAENTSQVVTIANFFISEATSFVSAVIQNDTMQSIIQTVNAFPSPIVGVITPYFGVKLFDFLRGR